MLSRRQGLWAALAATVVFFGCSTRRDNSTPPLPNLPDLAVESLEPVVREQVREASDAAHAAPLDASANGRLGMVLHAHEQFGAAAVCYERAHRLEPNSFQWAYYLGWVQAAQGKNAEAVTTLRQALEQDPNHLPAELQLAQLLLSSGKPQESGEIYEQIIKGAPASAPAHYGLGRVREAQEQLSAAVASYRKACDLFPNYGVAHYALSLVYRRLGESERAQHHFKLYERNKSTAPTIQDPLLTDVHNLNHSAVHFTRAGLQLSRAGRLREAAAAYERSLELDPRDVKIHASLIGVYSQLGLDDEAKKHYEAALRLDPNHAPSHYFYGVSALKRSEYEVAAQAFERTLEINPFHAESHNNLGRLLEQQGKPDEAEQHYRQAVENKPGYRVALFNLGRLLVEGERYDEGIEYLLKTLMPEDDRTATYLHTLAEAYEKAGSRDKALEYARNARQKAVARGQRQLVSTIDTYLSRLNSEGASR